MPQAHAQTKFLVAEAEKLQPSHMVVRNEFATENEVITTHFLLSTEEGLRCYEVT